MYSPFCSTTFCHFSGNFIILCSQNFLSFWAKNCARCLLQSPGNWTNSICWSRFIFQKDLIIEDSLPTPGLPWWLRQWRICPQCRRPRFDPHVGKIPWRRAWLPTPVFLPGKSHGQRSLVGYSPWGHRIRHNWMTSTFTFQHYHIHTITSSGWRMAFGVAGGNSFHLPQNLFHSTLLYSIYFSSLITICFKNRKFSLQICMQKCNQEGFSSHLCGTQTSMQLT